MSTKFELYDYQQEVLDLDRNRMGIAHDAGLGKSYTAMGLIEKANNYTIIISPKKVGEEWQERISSGMVNAEFFTKEQFKKEKRKYNVPITLVIDECHHYANNKSMMFKHMLDFIKKNNVTHLYIMTATPYRSSWLNVYCYYLLLGLIEKSVYKAWQEHFTEPMRMGALLIRKNKDTPETREEIQKLIADIFHMKSVVNENNTHTDMPISLPYIDTKDCVSWHEEYRLENRESDKVVWIKKFIETHKSAVIVCFYISEVEYLKSIFNCPTIYGKTDRTAYSKEKTPVLIIQCDTGEGYSLPDYDNMIFYSYSYKYISFVQVTGRIDRDSLENPTKNNYYYLINKKKKGKSFDEEILNSLRDKKDFSINSIQKLYPQKGTQEIL